MPERRSLRMNDTEIKRGVMQLRKQCAKYDGGYCIDYDKPCFAYDDRWSVHDGAMNCDYFNAAV